MKKAMVACICMVAVIPAAAADGAKPRVFLAGPEAETVTGEAVTGDAKSTLAFRRATPSYDLEVMRQVAAHCPGVVITTNREKASLIVRVEREDVNPATPFVKANRVAVFNLNDELIFTARARLLGNAVKNACPVLMERPAKN